MTSGNPTDDFANEVLVNAETGDDAAPASFGDLLTLLHDDPVIAEQLYQDLRRQLIRFLSRACREPEDAVQEVLVRGMRRISGGTSLGERGARAYFFGIARNVIREEWKPKRRREQQMTPEAWDLRGSGGREAERTEAVVELQQTLSRLEPADREFLLRYVDEGPVELARELGKSVQNVRVIAFRLRERLRAGRQSS
jgi:RNA polymerase sigma-70 factor (ECF subfamily)